MFVEGVLWIARVGSPWRDLPDVFGGWNRIFRRVCGSSRTDVWWLVFVAVTDDEDFEDLFVNSTIVRAREHDTGAKTRRRQQAPRDRSLGRSRGGLSSRIHFSCSQPRLSGALCSRGGGGEDAHQAAALLESLPADVVLANAAHDGGFLRNRIARKRAEAVAPGTSPRTCKPGLDRTIHAQRA